MLLYPEPHVVLNPLQVRHQAGDYMRFQKEINPNMRAILVDWLVEVAEEYKLSSETLYLGVCYLDRYPQVTMFVFSSKFLDYHRYLSRKSIARRELQLLGVACMLLASYHVNLVCIPVYSSTSFV